ncbi:hypothetical protein F5Y12DRAFT_745034 [Xylaria sp. FL1777]|nr:hypothetical protein F5Y12DRAFT_745034 [Xylaria sp. FL1777]
MKFCKLSTLRTLASCRQTATYVECAPGYMTAHLIQQHMQGKAFQVQCAKGTLLVGESSQELGVLITKMPLKRGLERESCDFCFRRKIKCDRSSLAATDRPACSQCDLRQIPCTFDCDDIRIRRRRKCSPKEKTLNVNTSIETEPGQHLSHGCIRIDEPTRAGNSTLNFGNYALPPLFYDSTTVSSRFTSDIGIAASAQRSMTTSALPIYSDFDFELSSNSISFLDSVFLQGQDTTEAIANRDDMPSPALQPINEPQESLTGSKNPYCALYVEPETLDAAIDAYFSFASLSLPILSKDGFMADYKARQSSSALVFAVACQGCPFIQATEKWSLQQLFALRFREAFLEARSTTSNQDVVRLDDLEALALMVDFEYENTEGLTSPLQSQLENLLLTHDSLVRMVLHYRIETRITTAAGLSTTLSRTPQRQTILFWYVYGEDAFCSLDRKMPSKIEDEDIELSTRIQGHESQSYFDAILSLAAIARKMSRVLCSPLAKRKGAKHQDVENLYKQLEEWRINICPPALRIPLSSPVSPPQERPLSSSTDMKEFPPIYKVIMTLLELSCFLQLEEIVSEHGIEECGSPMGHIVEMRIKYETLQAVYNIVEVAQWIEELTASQTITNSAATHVMADLAPGVIRNVCAGASNWIYQQAKELFHLARNERLNSTMEKSDCVTGNGKAAGLSGERAKGWMESLTTLRDIAATATSHRDTERMIKQMDQQLESLEALANTHDR